MTLDLLHNKIIKETHTEAFEKSVNDNLVPKLYALYGASLSGVQFYEDYINDSFIKDGYWYYPLTVVIDGVYAILWIKWDVSDERAFSGGNPYAFVGEGEIDFLLADDIPIAFKNSIEGRSNYFEGGYVKLNVSTDAPDPKILAGKYSQTFVDEMNRQISYAISRACGVKGIENSSIELDIVFAPNTYMEHTSENVTYRRLLISAKGCSARDFWIKWTRKNSSVAFSVNDNVTENDIVFEIGEDVSQKIREKEYRFLVYGNSDKYRVAMGRKNVTEWRELIKRALKRGELEETNAELEESSHVAEVSDKLSEILEKCGVTIPTATSNDIRVDAEVANEALRLAVLGGESESENYVPDIPSAEEMPETEQIVSELDEDTNAIETASEEDTSEDTFAEDAQASTSNEGEAELPELELEIYDENSSENSGEEAEVSEAFDFGNGSDVFDITEEGADELSFEDILSEFIPKSDDSEEQGEELPKLETLDISDVDESESVSFDINKGDYAYVETEDYADAEKEDTLPELEVEVYEEEPEEEIPVQAIAEEEITEQNISVEYDEMSETLTVPEVIKEPDASVTGEAIIRLESEIASLKHQLEMERIAKEDAEAKLEDAIITRITVENDLKAEREGRIEAEEKLRAALTAKETLEDRIDIEIVASQELRAQNEKQRFAIDQVKKLVEEETSLRNSAEEELALLRSEMEGLRSENENLKEIARIAEQNAKHHERELLNQIELTEKERAREKSLFAEAARQAKEENDQRFAELKEAEIARIEEEARIEVLRRAEEERLKLQEELKYASAFAEPSAEDRKRELEDRAREVRIKMEQRARLDAEAKAISWGDNSSTTAPVCENNAVISNNDGESVDTHVYDTNANTDPCGAYAEQEPIEVATPAPVVNYNYTSYIVRLMFRRSADPNVTARIHEMISYALTEFGKEEVYMKVKASMPDNYTVILNFVKFPEEEFDLLVKIINYLGKSDLGVYKVVLD